MASEQPWMLKENRMTLGEQSLVVGILNVTPDSFSDGGRYAGVEGAVRRAGEMLEEGAGIIDIGGESTRPGFEAVAEEEEIERVVPVIQAILVRYPDCIISVDTMKAKVAQAAVDEGALIVNDVSGLLQDAEMPDVAAHSKSGLILMRNGRFEAETGAILDRIRASWEHSVKLAVKNGVSEAAIVLDPGVGFGTTRQEDLEILQGLEVLRAFGFPMMLGTSRKRITSCPGGWPLDQRLETTLATSVAGAAAGIELFRVHDVAANVRALGMADLIYRGGKLDE